MKFSVTLFVIAMLSFGQTVAEKVVDNIDGNGGGDVFGDGDQGGAGVKGLNETAVEDLGIGTENVADMSAESSAFLAGATAFAAVVVGAATIF